MPVRLLSIYLMDPRLGHLEQEIRCFTYITKYNRSKIVFDDTHSAVNNSRFLNTVIGMHTIQRKRRLFQLIIPWPDVI